jgi:23S rRNA (pseudouridine1915-N3)-methyltransferase
VVDLVEIEVRGAGTAPEADSARRIEGERLTARIPPGSRTIALDRTGQLWSSEDLARQLRLWREGGRPVTLILGGSHGLDPGILHDCQQRWSLGPLTLPHELARVIVLEQLYRAGTMLRGEPYHK